jgi:hypothetical protein
MGQALRWTQNVPRQALAGQKMLQGADLDNQI